MLGPETTRKGRVRPWMVRCVPYGRLCLWLDGAGLGRKGPKAPIGEVPVPAMTTPRFMRWLYIGVYRRSVGRRRTMEWQSRAARGAGPLWYDLVFGRWYGAGNAYSVENTTNFYIACSPVGRKP